MDLGLAGRSYVLMGASRGLGLAAAQALVEEQANVVLVARDQAAVTQAAEALGAHAIGVAADLASPSTSEIVTAAALARFGRLDGALISGPSPVRGSPLVVSDEAWRAGFESLFLGALRVARATMLAGTQEAVVNGKGASILFVLSTSARSPQGGLAVSNGLRPGLGALVTELADEAGPRGVRVNGILPGRIATDDVFAQDARNGDPMNVRRRQESTIPLRRYGQPQEFGQVAAFLLSPAASYITGSLVSLDGGRTRGL